MLQVADTNSGGNRKEKQPPVMEESRTVAASAGGEDPRAAAGKNYVIAGLEAGLERRQSEAAAARVCFRSIFVGGRDGRDLNPKVSCNFIPLSPQAPLDQNNLHFLPL